ncbi:MAG: polyisoprenoid-binding protein [Proteobacteria bacterium]|nr:polyisoprenoid-binding protein [Pseudomonadota bacterium]
MRGFGLVMAGLVVSSSVWAAGMPFTPPELDYTKAEKGTYVVEPNHAMVVWKIWHMGFSHYTGRFDKVSGTLSFDPAHPEASKVSVAIDAASADTTSAKLNEELASGQFFDAAKYPTISFASTKVELGPKTADGKASGKVYGNLTLHGVTKPVVLDVVFNGSGANPMSKADMLGFSASTTIKRSDYGVDYGVPLVGDEVQLNFEIEMTRAG